MKLKLGPNLNKDESPTVDIAFKQLLTDQTYLKKRVDEEIEFSDPIITNGYSGIIYPHTINVIQGKKGTHKSRLTEGLITCLLSPEKQNYLNLYREHDDPNQYEVLYVDTERNIKDQFPYSLQNIARKSGYKTPGEITNFDFISLVNIERNDRFAAVEKYINHAKQKTDKHLIVVLDVMTDCIDSFNDAKNSMKLIDLMNRSINQEEVTYICVIHENPGSEKARGHLGTEVANKASTQIQISIEKGIEGEELIKIKYLKTRRSRRPAEVFAIFNEETKDLELADEDLIKKVEQSGIKKAPLKEVMDAMTELLVFETPRMELIEDLMKKFKCSKNTIVARIKEIEAGSLIFDDFQSKSTLKKSKRGKEIYYQLQKIDNEIKVSDEEE